MKSLAAVEGLLIVGMAAIAATMFIQIPKEMEQLTTLTSLSSVSSVAKGISGLIAASAVSPAVSPTNISILYKLPEEASYTIYIDGYDVKVAALFKETKVKIESVTEKIPFKLEPKKMIDVKILEINKTIENGKNMYEVNKYE
jgi:hypothetical protein